LAWRRIRKLRVLIIVNPWIFSEWITINMCVSCCSIWVSRCNWQPSLQGLDSVSHSRNTTLHPLKCCFSGCLDVLLKKLSVALLKVLDGMVLGLHLAGVLLQAEAQVRTYQHDLLKQGAHMLGVACRERPTRVVSWKLGVTNDGHMLTPHCVALILNMEQGNGSVIKDRQVALTELREGLVGSPLQSVIKVVAPSRGEPSRHGRVSGVSRDVHIDLAGPKPELTRWVTMVHGGPHVAKAVQHVLEQGEKTRTVQPVTTEPFVTSEGGVGVVIHLSKTRERRINISSIKQRQQTKTSNKPPRQISNPDSDFNR
jgi:hypothetical protein